jgi:hypothetical protein
MLKETRSLLSSGESAVYFSLDDPLFRGLEVGSSPRWLDPSMSRGRCILMKFRIGEIGTSS